MLIKLMNHTIRHIMCQWLNMKYHWSYSKHIGFMKFWDIDTVLKNWKPEVDI